MEALTKERCQRGSLTGQAPTDTQTAAYMRESGATENPMVKVCTLSKTFKHLSVV